MFNLWKGGGALPQMLPHRLRVLTEEEAKRGKTPRQRRAPSRRRREAEAVAMAGPAANSRHHGATRSRGLHLCLLTIGGIAREMKHCRT